MTIQEILTSAYEDTNTSTANYPYSKALSKLNAIYKEVYRMIVTVQEDYFWNKWDTELQEGAREYAISREETTRTDEEGVLHTVPGIAKVKKVICDGRVLPQLADNEEDTEKKGRTLKDNSIFLNRTPTKNGLLEIYGIEAIKDVVLIDTADVIFPGHADLKDFASVLEWGIKKELWEHKQDFDKADRCNNYYQNELEKMKRYITQRVQSIYYSELN